MATMSRYIRVLCFGSRRWSDVGIIYRELKLEHDEAFERSETLIVIHGDYDGADKLSGKVAHWLGIHYAAVPAIWDLFGSPAGPIRNDVMVTGLRPHFAIGFNKDIEKSRGSKDCRNRLEHACIPVRVVSA